ncbi:threonine/serine ThrE exporter family protein [Actinomyces minihominis]|uniref:threonine/serine ThrE exporter family protein n=1 Tax=Actinomyces minihominis TaxID=2002838 RepID=UPI000C087790|nr:threonine/serine exporter family protein [Actinomyces minihominis]
MVKSAVHSLSSLWWRTLGNDHPPVLDDDESDEYLTASRENSRIVLHILDFAARLGDAMLAVGASAHEVTVASGRAARSYGLHGVHVVVTYNSLSVSYQQHEDQWPATITRVVKWDQPNHAKLQALQELLVAVEDGLELPEARSRLRELRRSPFPYNTASVAGASALLAMGVSIMFGASAVIMILTFFAALLAAFTQAGLSRFALPMFFSQMAGGFVVTLVAVGVSALAHLGLEPFIEVRPSIIVVAGIMMMLAGMSAVGATQDAIDGFAVTASGRILDLTMRTLGVVIGILLGLQLGSLFGVEVPLLPTAVPFGSIPHQMVGAALVSGAAALTNGGRIRMVGISAILGMVSIVTFAGASLLGIGVAIASALGALFASFIGGTLAVRTRIPEVAMTTAAIIPLVPGVSIFRGLLGIVQAEGSFDGLVIGGNALVVAAMTAVAIAAGVSLGLYISTPWRSKRRHSHR